jgi:hypothetical protein
MKRYNIDADIVDRKLSFADPYLEVTESPDGEWVRAEDAEQAIGTALEFNVSQLQYVTEALYAHELEIAKLRAVVDSLPRCDHSACQKPATVRGVTTGGEYEYNVSVCDKHAEHVEGKRDLPHADALRELEKA